MAAPASGLGAREDTAEKTTSSTPEGAGDATRETGGEEAAEGGREKTEGRRETVLPSLVLRHAA